jgi:hypothetical protein
MTSPQDAEREALNAAYQRDVLSGMSSSEHWDETGKLVMKFARQFYEHGWKAGRASLSSPQEPYAWVSFNVLTGKEYLGRLPLTSMQKGVYKHTPLYAAPQAAPSPARKLAKHQPCGCVICTCEDEERCHGCGAKNCGNHPVGQFAAPAYEPAPSPPQGSSTPRTGSAVSLMNEDEFSSAAFKASQPVSLTDVVRAHIADLRRCIPILTEAGMTPTAAEFAKAADELEAASSTVSLTDEQKRCNRCGRYEDGKRPCPNGDPRCPTGLPSADHQTEDPAP